MIRTILVPLDGSPLSESVLPALRRLVGAADPTGSARKAGRTTRFGPSVTLLQTVPPGHGSKVELDLAQARTSCERVRQELGLSGLSASVLVLRGDPVETILRTAEELGAELVAMATHGRTGAARLARGSVAEGVLRGADAPVLLVNAHTHRSGPGALRRVVVPLDGTDRSRLILPVVARLTPPAEADLILLRIVEPAEADPGALQAAEASLEPARRELVALGAAAVRRVVRVGRPAEEILSLVEAERADLVAMATHGRRGLERLWLGSVAEGVARAAVVPVVVLRAPGA